MTAENISGNASSQGCVESQPYVPGCKVLTDTLDLDKGRTLSGTVPPASMPGALASAQATRNTITLRGSAQLVTEFFGYAVSRFGTGCSRLASRLLSSCQTHTLYLQQHSLSERNLSARVL